MEMLLTPEQESALWHFAKTIITESGTRYWYFPYFLRSNNDEENKNPGSYDRLNFDQLPESVKDALLKNQGIKLPTE